MQGLYQAVIHFGEEGRRCWEWESSEEFSVKSLLRFLVKEKADMVLQPIWDSSTSFSVALFACKLNLGEFKFFF